MSQDPIGLSGGDRVYSFVKDSCSMNDPLGLTPLDQGGFSIYGLFEAGADKPYYIGVSNDPVRRELEHLNSGRLSDTGELRVLNNDLTYAQARGKEQLLIEQYETKTGVIGESISENIRGNKVNSFDKNRIDSRGKAFKAEYDKAKANQVKIRC